ncbi:MAG: zinc ribbon domain-containing protein [Armatimonadota bacterium]
MAEPKVCFVCGRTHERTSRVCAACAAAYASSGPIDPVPGSPTPAPVSEPRPVPLPPQLRPAAPAPAAPAPPPAPPQTPARSCPACGATITDTFTFCTACGADLPAQGTAPTPPPAQAHPLPNGVRDTRATVRRIAEAYGAIPDGGGQAQMPRPGEPASTVDERLAHPMTLAILSFFFPGVGQFLNRQSAKGFALLIAGFITVTLMGLAPFAFVLLALRILVAIDAYRIGQKRARGEEIAPDEWGFG